MILCFPAEPLPLEWLVAAGNGSTYAGMNLTHFICRNCQLAYALTTAFTHQPNLRHLDVSFNPVASGNDSLPLEAWSDLPLATIKVGKLLHLAAVSYYPELCKQAI